MLKNSFHIFCLLLVASCSTPISQGPHSGSRDLASLRGLREFCAAVFGKQKEIGKAFVPSAQMGQVQIGVNPRSLIPTKDLSALDSLRLRNAETYGRDQAIKVNSLGFILDGHHRLYNAIREGRSVDVVIEALESNLSSRDLVKRPLVVHRSQIASALELSHLKKNFLDQEANYILAFKNRDPELTLAHFLSLSHASQNLFLNLLDFYKTQKNTRILDQEFEALTGFELRNSFFANVLEFERGPGNFLAALENFQKLPSIKQQEWSGKASEWSRRTREQNEWQKFYYSKIPLKVSGKKVELHLRDQVLTGFIRGQELILTVPTSLIRHPAWNPLDHLEQVAAHTFSGPREYKVNFALDGNFYLFDGNHRFAIYGASKSQVKVKLFLKYENGKPYLYTSPLRNCFDDWGHAQPTPEQLEKLSKKEISAESLVHPNLQGRLLPITEQP